MFTLRAPSALLLDNRLHCSQKLLYMVVPLAAEKVGGAYECQARELAYFSGVSDRSVRMGLARLEALGYLRVDRAYGKGGGLRIELWGTRKHKKYSATAEEDEQPGEVARAQRARNTDYATAKRGRPWPAEKRKRHAQLWRRTRLRNLMRKWDGR